MSWVERLPKGRHRAVYRDPERRRLSKTVDRKADIKQWSAAADTDQARGQWIDPRGGAMLAAEDRNYARAARNDAVKDRARRDA